MPLIERSVAQLSQIWYAQCMTIDTDIQLSGPFKAKDSSGTEQEVKAIRIFDEGYGMIDVYVDLMAASENSLYTDKVFVGQIMARLHTLGYDGPDFEHSDPALQDKNLVVLEAPEEFCDFAGRHGWKNLAEEFDDDEDA